MFGWIHVVVVASSIVVLTLLLALLVWRWCCYKQRKDFADTLGVPSFRATGNNITRASVHHQPDNHNSDAKRIRGNNHYVFPRGVSVKPLFSWSDHPSLINDAVENGWSQFAFTDNNTSSSTITRSASLLGLCVVGDHGIRETEAEISWEVCQGSLEYMQKIRFNSGLKRLSISQRPSTAATTVIRTALPLPGPSLGNNIAFPQEAYFEITILFSHGDDKELDGTAKEGERTKLIHENLNVKANYSESLVHVTSSSRKVNKVEEKLKVENEESGKGEMVKLSLGLTAGGSLPSKLPGSYPGSIGFNSNGSVYLDGIKLVYESEEVEWGRTEKVIGCGFHPRQKKVFFTVDSELVHVVHCKSEEFGTPLYPILAANTDILVLVNMGQSVFKYGPANAHRTPNPCFIHPPLNSPDDATMDYEDSTDLFSMAFDSQYFNAYAVRGSQNGTSKQGKDSDQEGEVELFEIVLEDSGRYSNAVS
ncbi:Concanavalin A-like lectin/glucanase domain containing protein [Fagus crenata]